MGFVFGLAFALIILLTLIWNNTQVRKENNKGIENPEDKKKD
jgi:hypothetical protein